MVLYTGDTRLYYDCDVLSSKPWTGYSESSNLIVTAPAASPSCQAITLDIFRQIKLNLDPYLSKRAWATEGAFSSFQGVMLGMIRNTKRVYDGTLYNAFIGTDETSTGKQQVSVDLGTGSGHPLYNLTGVEKEQMEAMLIAKSLADLIVDMRRLYTLI